LGNFRPKAEEISNFENVKIIFQREIFYKVKSKIALVLGPVSYTKQKKGGERFEGRQRGVWRKEEIQSLI